MSVLTIGPRQVAETLTDPDNPEALSVEELTTDIQRDPRLYYPEYVAACEAAQTQPLPIGMWVDFALS